MKNLSQLTQRSALGAIALCAIGLAGWHFLPSHAETPAASSEDNLNVVHSGQYLSIPEKSALRKTIALETIAKGAVTSVFTLPASVEADPAKFVKVLTPLTGKITSINKRLGDTVKAGDLLFTVESPDFAQAQSDAKKAQAALELARQNFSRQQDLAKSELAAKRDIEQAQNDLEQAASELTRANARLAQLGAGATLNNGHTLAVHSPISGSVVDLNAAVGAYWNDATAAIMSVADLSSVFVTASAQEKDLSQLSVGQDATISFDAYGSQTVKAVVRDIGQILDTDTRTVKVRMSLANPVGQFKPGMFDTVRFETKPHAGISVPVTAVIQSGFYSRAFVEVKPWQFEPRVVKLGTQSGNRVEILDGLQAGERVVIKNGVLLND